MTRSMKFAGKCAAALRTPKLRPVSGVCIVVGGRLDTTVTIARLKIEIPWRFKDLKRTPPRVWCNEAWMKTGADWHNGPPLCWVLPHLWRDVMAWRGKPVRAIMEEGLEWMLRDVTSLVNRHYAAHLEGLDAWPNDWEAWGHGTIGMEEYRRARPLDQPWIPRGRRRRA